MTLAVTGGTGFVGQAVLAEAVRRGMPVRALARREQEPREGIAWVRGDLADTAALADLVAGTDAVVHIAGVINSDAAGFQSGNVAGTEAVIEAARSAGVRRFVAVSSLAAREPMLSAYGRSKRLAEEAVQTSGLDWTIVRPPTVYGPHDREVLDLFRAARWGVVPMPAGGSASIIHADDLARLLLALVPSGAEVSERIFEPDDGRPGGWPHRELAQALGAAVGRKVWGPPVGRRMLSLAARADRVLRGGKAKLTLDRVGYMSHPDWVSRPERAVPAELWAPQIDTAAGLALTARWYREQGWL
ncbi:MAG: epimerase [Sphingomonadales bacterium 32-68-7]|nr:MAG: epimerase [Sphingomonadales bacterium 12-68-11]OYX08400.1 MAG: epimerase [Sphingomonadales bacterium 32-68-7]